MDKKSYPIFSLFLILDHGSNTNDPILIRVYILLGHRFPVELSREECVARMILFPYLLYFDLFNQVICSFIYLESAALSLLSELWPCVGCYSP